MTDDDFAPCSVCGTSIWGVVLERHISEQHPESAAAAHLSERDRERQRKRQEDTVEPTDLTSSRHVRLVACVLVGGFGYPLVPGPNFVLDFGPTRIDITGPSTQTSIAYQQIVRICIEGPGREASGGGFIGGGFGLDGALVGIFAASVLNALTTRHSNTTYVQIEAHDGELFFLYTLDAPFPVRIALSHAFVATRGQRSGTPAVAGPFDQGGSGPLTES